MQTKSLKPGQQILISRFWNNVTAKADATAVLVKNPDTESKYVYGGVGPMGMGGGAIVVTPPKYSKITWDDAGRIVAEITARLMDAGVRRGDRVALLSWNCPEWVWTDLAIQSLGAVSVPIYPNNGADQVIFVAQNAGASLVIADCKSQADKVTSTDGHGLTAMLFDNLTAGSQHYQLRLHGRKEGITFQNDEAVLTLSPRAQSIFNYLTGQSSGATFMEATPDGVKPQGVTRKDTAKLIYTSGSSGVPKGVEITHGNVACSCESVYEHGFNFGDEDLYLSYLPLAHVYENVNGMGICLWNGVTVAFCKVEEVGKMLPDLHPTIVLGVPLVWRRMKDKIQSQMDAAKGFKAKLIKWAFAQKKGTFKHWLADMLVFRTVRNGLGGRLRILGSGGAPISPDVLKFFQSVGLEIIEGYGLTETSGAIVANRPGQTEIGTVGFVVNGAEVKIVPAEGDTSGSGEIWLRGGVVSPGYWQLPEENASAFTADGWFKTGDKGFVDANGRLHITGRLKRLFKTDGGKYVAPEKIEKAFDNAAIIQAIVPVGDSKPFIGAVIFINPIAAKELLRAKGVSIPAGDADAQQAFFAKHELVKEAVAAAVKEANATLEHWETVKKVEIIEDAATVENGLLTASQKVRPTEVMKRYGDRIEAMFVKPGKGN
ncbi:MAG: long-chain fatty acid--CoA ligase [Cyanobacteria bacterium SZAS LIN-2]|nr:long-chain fatty acid--CoA ligase [Cyanobacteria bacterium SZAS LIN-2]